MPIGWNAAGFCRSTRLTGKYLGMSLACEPEIKPAENSEYNELSPEWKAEVLQNCGVEPSLSVKVVLLFHTGKESSRCSWNVFEATQESWT
jgi:hypothetical protein